MVSDLYQKDFTLAKLSAETAENVGSAFAVGTLAGCLIYSAIGAVHAPRGRRIMTALCHTRDRAPLFGGSIAMWSFLFGATRSSLIYLRQKDDKWNAAFGGFAAGIAANIRGSIALGIG